MKMPKYHRPSVRVLSLTLASIVTFSGACDAPEDLNSNDEEMIVEGSESSQTEIDQLEVDEQQLNNDIFIDESDLENHKIAVVNARGSWNADPSQEEEGAAAGESAPFGFSEIAEDQIPEARTKYTREWQERGTDTPTSHYWYTSVSAATIESKVDAGYRPIDIQVRSTSPLRFTTTMVKNSGDHRRSKWWWYYGKTSSEIKSLLKDHSARITDLEIYYDNGKKRYAALMVPNTGSNYRAWWYYSALSYSSLKSKLSEKNARIIDIDSYLLDGTRYYSAVLMKKSGTENVSSWWYTNLNADEVKEKVDQKNARIVDIEKRDDGKFIVVLEPKTGGKWWWATDVSYSELKRRKDNYGARIVDLERYKVGNSTRYSAIMLNNSNATETATGEVLREGLKSNGSIGFYLKRRGGSELATRREDVSVYPASTIKVLEHLHALREVQDRNTTLGTVLDWYERRSESCQDTHNGHDLSRDTLRTLTRDMMKNSDNQATNALQEFFGDGDAGDGRDAINASARSLGGVSSGTRLRHKLACGGASNNPSNLMRLSDMAGLYERVANGSALNSTHRELFYDLMLNENDSMFISRIVDEEAPAGVDRAAFKRGIRLAHKAGSVTDHTSVAGWASLPTRTGTREFTYGVFVEFGSASPWDGARELLRREIRAALETFR